jgi:putative metallohydrolase (TIGR04338 family)
MSPAQRAVYAAETRALDDLGMRWQRIGDVQRYVDELIGSAWFFDRWPHFVRATVERRPRGSRWSCAHPLDAAGPVRMPTESVILLADGAWTQPVVLHELAHLLSPPDAGHGAAFVDTQLALVRHDMGLFAFASYERELRRQQARASERRLRPCESVSK